eukprot:CAMPEP_0177362772 /NCGR_PEP_ID=MMETSP0368-20130122/37893_1 /TAXON_ID=447022 ORGANISM="Scrippsiella hangoei-like, Strain SHHI-4" /NCGR_SAMPLE_ID=MMETSP0368 /ASSEMBLY_ACC=CAM_ASM_000363 /LENGTH=32 /DNA_ID= /DNA_START= /DNA_END= /DNA_ORIENTATION=
MRVSTGSGHRFATRAAGQTASTGGVGQHPSVG